jgi:hypothetical protein
MPLGRLGRGSDKSDDEKSGGKKKQQSDDSGSMNKQQRDDMTGRNPNKPIAGSDAWARKNNQPPYDK